MLVANLFGGPGTGKSNMASRLYSELDKHSMRVEYVPEFAKGAAWEKRSDKFFRAQQYIYGTQSWWLERLIGEVDIVITDAPLLNNIAYYNDSLNIPSLKKVIIEDHNRYNNINFFLERIHPYRQEGRNQKEEEAVPYDEKIKSILTDAKAPFRIHKPDENGFYCMALEILTEYRRLTS